MRYVVPLGRALFTAIFLTSAPHHFTKQTIAYGASQGVPLPGLLVPLSGAIAIVGALSILLGYGAKIGGWLLVVFLVPVTFVMHDFWAVKGPAVAMTQQIMFMKNLSMLGGALLISHFGAGPVSLDELIKARGERRA
jgi:putative oxidoreductase